jgi:hypothetical protein
MKEITITREIKKNNFLYLLGKNFFIMFLGFITALIPNMFIMGWLTSFQNIWNYDLWFLISLIIGLIIISYSNCGIETEQVKEKVWIEDNPKKVK